MNVTEVIEFTLHSTTPSAYGDPSDLRQTVRFLRAHYGRVAVLGFGAGADLLLAYLGDTGSSSGLVAAVAVSPLYEPDKLLDQSPWPIGVLRRRALQRVVSEHGGVLSRAGALVDVEGALSASHWHELEQKVLWPACGATSAAQYWERNAPLRDADDIATPLLLRVQRRRPRGARLGAAHGPLPGARPLWPHACAGGRLRGRVRILGFLESDPILSYFEGWK
ncbi:hypothetical protein HPB48_025546 [Haemaphysalis longicornis]|uniref:Uncharacterized protein n=1 Tax=Haemaphysalis longicornis TaxID=44386 RepID=A0A9J6HA21_HAELO|nr:hypothetical protein HPB48_025546 [Haemaphysalis longicornis]